MTDSPQAPQEQRPASENLLDKLPTYARSLLRIRVPVAVSLARKQELIGDVLELGPGAIIKFDKACDEPLQLMVGNVTVAEGDAVKVGDKFGLRIAEILLPPERFRRAVCSQMQAATESSGEN